MEFTEKPGNHSQPECLETADETARLQSGFHHHQLRHRISREEHEEVDRANNEVVVEATFMVTKLTTNVEYQFRVTAVKSVGPGGSSESVAFKADVPEAPVIKEPLKDATAGLKETATLSCIIIGVPKPTLKWYNDDNEFVPKSSSYEKGSARLRAVCVLGAGQH